MRMKPKRFKGTIPTGPDWVIIAAIGNWVVSCGKRNGHWRNVKVAYDGIMDHKANYLTTWNGERLADSKDVVVMKEKRPDLFQSVTTALIENNDRLIW